MSWMLWHVDTLRTIASLILCYQCAITQVHNVPVLTIQQSGYVIKMSVRNLQAGLACGNNIMSVDSGAVFVHVINCLYCVYLSILQTGACSSTIVLIVFSFGKRTAGCVRRVNDCLTLEPSEMIVVGYLHVYSNNNHRTAQVKQINTEPTAVSWGMRRCYHMHSEFQITRLFFHSRCMRVRQSGSYFEEIKNTSTENTILI